MTMIDMYVSMIKELDQYTKESNPFKKIIKLWKAKYRKFQIIDGLNGDFDPEKFYQYAYIYRSIALSYYTDAMLSKEFIVEFNLNSDNINIFHNSNNPNYYYPKFDIHCKLNTGITAIHYEIYDILGKETKINYYVFSGPINEGTNPEQIHIVMDIVREYIKNTIDTFFKVLCRRYLIDD